MACNSDSELEDYSEDQLKDKAALLQFTHRMETGLGGREFKSHQDAQTVEKMHVSFFPHEDTQQKGLSWHVDVQLQPVVVRQTASHVTVRRGEIHARMKRKPKGRSRLRKLKCFGIGVLVAVGGVTTVAVIVLTGGLALIPASIAGACAVGAGAATGMGINLYDDRRMSRQLRAHISFDEPIKAPQPSLTPVVSESSNSGYIDGHGQIKCPGGKPVEATRHSHSKGSESARDAMGHREDKQLLFSGSSVRCGG